MIFHPLDLDSIPEFRHYLPKISARTCDYTIGGTFMWRHYFRMEYAVYANVLYSRLFTDSGDAYYNLPLSDDMVSALTHLLDALRKTGETIRFCTIPEQFLPVLESVCRIRSVTPQPDYFDYLYRTEDLAALSGKKYNGQRNLIKQFTRLCENWHFRQITPGDIPMIREFFLTRCPGKPDSPTAREEQMMVLDVLDHFPEYGMFGGVLIRDGAVAGFSLGEIAGNTLFVHVEKADRTVKGAYQMLSNQFILHFAAGRTAFVNREEDMGDPGLKKAKEAYHPTALLRKYTVEVS